MGTMIKGAKHILYCNICVEEIVLRKKDVSAIEWEEDYGWKQLRSKAMQNGWKLGASINQSHFCNKCEPLK
jgi:hypothetical protein